MMNFNETIVLIGEDVSMWTCYKFCKFYALFSYFLKKSLSEPMGFLSVSVTDRKPVGSDDVKKYTGTLLLTSARDKQFIINRFLYIR